MVDGKRLNKPGDGLFDLNTLPVPIENVERVEILSNRWLVDATMLDTHSIGAGRRVDRS